MPVSYIQDPKLIINAHCALAFRVTFTTGDIIQRAVEVSRTSNVGFELWIQEGFEGHTISFTIDFYLYSERTHSFDHCIYSSSYTLVLTTNDYYIDTWSIAGQYIQIPDATPQREKWDFDQIFISWKTYHTTPPRVNYGVFVVSWMTKFDREIPWKHCIKLWNMIYCTRIVTRPVIFYVLQKYYLDNFRSLAASRLHLTHLSSWGLR